MSLVDDTMEASSRLVFLTAVLALFLAAGCIGAGDEAGPDLSDEEDVEDASAEDPGEGQDASDRGGEEPTDRETQEETYMEESFEKEGTTSVGGCAGAVMMGYCMFIQASDQDASFHDPSLAPAEEVSFEVAWDEPGIELEVTFITDAGEETFQGTSPIEETLPVEGDTFEIEVSSYQGVNTSDPAWVMAGAQPIIEFTLEGTAILAQA